MNMDKVKKYQDDIPYLGDPKLYDAAQKAIFIIVQKHGQKSDSIKNVARKYKVNQVELARTVDEAIPKSFYIERTSKARKRYEGSFYSPPVVQSIPAEQKTEGNQKLSKIREMLKATES